MILNKFILIILLLFILSCTEIKQQEYNFIVLDTISNTVIYKGIGYGLYEDRKFASDMIKVFIYYKGNSVIIYGNNLMILQEKMDEE
jgi:hypothetical protein